MRAEERIAQLEAENAALREENVEWQGKYAMPQAEHGQLRTNYEVLRAELKAWQERMGQVTERRKRAGKAGGQREPQQQQAAIQRWSGAQEARPAQPERQGDGRAAGPPGAQLAAEGDPR